MTQDNNKWIFERSSGYAGYRCQECYTWIYANQEKTCKCNKHDNKFDESMVNLDEITNNEEIKNLISKRIEIDNKIRSIDNMALIRYELACLKFK